MAEQPNSPSGAAEAAIPSAVESTDVISPSVSAKEKQDLFRSLQGEISFEQYEAWNKQNAQVKKKKKIYNIEIESPLSLSLSLSLSLYLSIYLSISLARSLALCSSVLIQQFAYELCNGQAV